MNDARINCGPCGCIVLIVLIAAFLIGLGEIAAWAGQLLTTPMW